jgi:phage terminase large subunit-like protein
MDKKMIQKYIARTKAYRTWFAKLPGKAINLEIVLTNDRDSWDDLIKMTPKKALSCGTVGCVEGWLHVYPPFKKAQVVPDDFMGTDECITNTGYYLFDSSQGGYKTERAEALARLDTRVKELKNELAKVGKA